MARGRRSIVLVAWAAGLLSLSACARSSVGANSVSDTPSTARATGAHAVGGETVIAEGDVILDQPPDGARPALTADQAAARAGIDPTGATITLVLYTTPHEHADPAGELAHDHQLAWDYHSTGCFPVPVPPGISSPPSCPATQQDVFVDANAGAMLGAWNYG